MLCALAVFVELIAMSGASDPSWATDPIFNCTFDESIPLALFVTIADTQVACGKPRVFSKDEVAEAPKVALRGAKPDAFYTMFLLNPDWIIPVGPILHHAVGNIPGARFANGSLADASIIYPFHHPAPPSAFFFYTFHYSYLVFEHTEKQDYSDLVSMPTERVKIEDVLGKRPLTLVQANHFRYKLGSLV